MVQDKGAGDVAFLQQQFSLGVASVEPHVDPEDDVSLGNEAALVRVLPEDDTGAGTEGTRLEGSTQDEYGWVFV